MKLARIFSNKGSLSRNAKTQTQGKNMVRDRISFASRLKELRMIAHIPRLSWRSSCTFQGQLSPIGKLAGLDRI